MVRLLQAPVVLLVLITISFFLIRFAPGNPFSGDRNVDPQVMAALEAKYRLDRPLAVQYGCFLADLAKGDLGPSIKHKGHSVTEIIARALPASMLLGGLALCLALGMGLILGTIAALHQNSARDVGAMLLAVIGISLPTFVIGPMLQILFAMKLDWLPLTGYEGIRAPVYLMLPALTLAFPFAARIARLARAGMLEVLQQDYIRTARAKGLPERIVILRHALRGALMPVVSYLGPAIASVTTGSLVVEMIFGIPGLGSKFVESALNRDFTLVIGTVIVYGTFIVICNLIADLAYGLLDPRVRFQEAGNA